MWNDESLEDLPVGKLYDREMLRRMVPLLKPFRLRIAAAGLVLLASSGLGLLPPLLLRRAIDVDIGAGNFPGLAATVGAYILLQFAIFGVNYLMAVVLEGLGVRMVSALKERLLGHLLDLDMAYFDRHPVGKLIARVESDTEAVRRLFTTTMFTLLGAVVSLAGMVAIMASVSARLFLAISLLIPPIVLLTVLFQRKVRPMFAVVRRKYAEIVGYLAEMIQGMRVVQAFSREEAVSDGMARLNRSYLKTQIPAEILAMGFFSLVGVFEIVGLAIVLFIGGGMVAGGLLTIGSLVLFLGYLRQFFMPVYAFSEQVGIMQRAFAAAERVFEILDMKPKVADSAAGAGWTSFEKRIEFRNVHFSYLEAENGKEPDWVLRDVSFTVGKGEKVALVGATGGGKTSVINLLLRFYQPQQGSILVDGSDIRGIRLESLRGKFGLVLQDVYLFPGSVRENLTLGAEMPEERIHKAVELLGLRKMLKRLPGGLDAELAERGSNLSQGERQLVSFARALAFDPEILILDEATSSVDPHSERLIQAGIRRLLAGRTAIIIAHRLSTIMDADRILVVHKGRIAESGTHRELLERNGYYARLYRIQFAA
jgi:ATP-binding cassette subfamily B protein